MCSSGPPGPQSPDHFNTASLRPRPSSSAAEAHLRLFILSSCARCLKHMMVKYEKKQPPIVGRATLELVVQALFSASISCLIKHWESPVCPQPREEKSPSIAHFPCSIFWRVRAETCSSGNQDFVVSQRALISQVNLSQVINNNSSQVVSFSLFQTCRRSDKASLIG